MKYQRIVADISYHVFVKIYDTCFTFKGMNVIMPTAMNILHTDAELKECAFKTAENGKKILRLLKGNELVMDNCMAIDRVCAELDGEDELFKVSARLP